MYNKLDQLSIWINFKRHRSINFKLLNIFIYIIMSTVITTAMIITTDDGNEINEIEIMDEMEEFSCSSQLQKESDDKKWLVVNEMIDHKRHNDLLKEVEYLKNMVIDMHKLMVMQNENIHRLGDSVGKMNESVILVSKDISVMKCIKIPYNKYSYIKDYLFPALRLAGTYTPFIVLLAAKTGIASSTLSFLFFRIFS